MADAQTATVEPFIDFISRPDGRFARVGYRIASLDQTMASIELPIQVLEQALASGIELSTVVTPTGQIISCIFGSTVAALSDIRTTASIDALVSQTVSLNNLRLEEVSATELHELLKSLDTAVRHVRAALMRTSVEV